MHRFFCIARLALAVSGVFALPASTLAHSGLARSTPAAGSTVTSAPKEVVLVFTEKLEPKFSSIEVRDTKNAAVQDGNAVVDPATRTHMRVALKPLPPGTYRVIWRVLSVDTHRTNGSFSFRVAP